MKINYSFKLGNAAPAPARPLEQLNEYAFSEFVLSLTDHWRELPMDDETALGWASEKADAAIHISVDFYEVPDEKAMDVAQFCLASRHEGLERAAPGQVTVLKKSAQPYSRGGALELLYAAQIPGSKYMYLGYVTPRKIFNFTLTCGPNSTAAGELFNRIVGEWLRIKLP